MNQEQKIMWGVILVSFVLAFALYPEMPEEMASHWNASGKVDGYIPKFLGVFLMPFLSLFMAGLFLLIPKVDPLKANIERFRKYYDGFIVFMLMFLLYIYILTLVWNLGFEFNMTRMILPSVGLLIYYLGILMENAKRNWFIGIRTPWTMSSDRVWDKTHAIGSRIYKAAGLIALVGIFFETYAMFLFFIPIVFGNIYLVVYSYLEYRTEMEAKK